MELNIISLLLFPGLFFGIGNGIGVYLNPDGMDMEPGQLNILNIYLLESVKEETTISFNYQEDDQIRLHQLKEVISYLSNITVIPGKLEYHTLVTAIDVGQVVVHLETNSSEIIEANDLLLDVNVYHSIRVEVIAEICGWIYVFAWSFKYVPQIYLNFKTKSIEGLSLDFVAFNLYGVVAYALYNVLLFWVPYLKNMYLERHPFGVFPVTVNDVFVSLTMLLVSLIQFGQCLIYDLAGQHLSKLGTVLLIVISVSIVLILILTLANVLVWLTFLTAISYIKVLSNPFKYIPQMILNYRRKSTEGWSIHYVIMDTIGSSGSLLQMFLQAGNQEDWSSLYGNFPKFSLGTITLICNIIFLVQHFILYRGQEPYVPLDQESETASAPEDKAVIPRSLNSTEKDRILQ